MPRLLPLLTLISLSFCLLVLPALADNLSSDSYRIDMGTINMTGGEKTSDSYRLTDTVGQTFQGMFEKNGYRIRAGFQYIHGLIPFRFSISNINIDFGEMIPQVAETQTNVLTVSSPAAYGYTVRAFEIHELRSGTNDIPDTACNPATPCTIADANIWNQAAAVGFGYNMSGEDVNTADFVDSTYYRPFANQEDGDTAAVVMSSEGVATESAATVTYRLNIDSSQPAGSYHTVVKFIAVPSF